MQISCLKSAKVYKELFMDKVSRRKFLKDTGISTVALGLVTASGKAEEVIQGFEDTKTEIDPGKTWHKEYDRKIRVGIAGYGVCRFGAAFGFQDHPNVEVAAVTDLIPARCQELAKACRCKKTCYHDDLYAMRELYKAGEFGKIIYSEGEYYHYMATPLDSYKGWRIGLPPQYYPTHSNAYYCGVTGGSFTRVACLGMPSICGHLTPSGNAYKNAFGTEIALFKTSEGGMSRMAVSWDTPGDSGEKGRIRGQKGSFYGTFEGQQRVVIPKKPPLPPTVSAGVHGGSHGYLTNEFIMSILENRKPLVDVTMALNMSVSGVVAHQSALKDGETLEIPQFVM